MTALKPRPFLVCFERTNAAAGQVWSVKTGRRWIPAKQVHVWVDVETVWRGIHAKQPRAYLAGVGVVRTDGHGTVTIAKA